MMSGRLRFSRKSSTVSTFCEAGFPQSKPRRGMFFLSCAGFPTQKRSIASWGPFFFLSGRICLFQKGFVAFVTQIAIISFTLPETNMSI